MDTSAWIAATSATVALMAVAVSLFQARSAGVQARAAESQVTVAKEQTKLQGLVHQDSLQPYVYADIRPDPVSKVFLEIVVENTGSTVATNVTIEFDPPLESTMKRDYEVPGIPSNFASLPPGRRMIWTLDSALSLFESSNSHLPRCYIVRITGFGPFGEIETLQYSIDLSEYINSAARNNGTLTELTKVLKGIAKSQDSISNKLGRIQEKLPRADDQRARNILRRRAPRHH